MARGMSVVVVLHGQWLMLDNIWNNKIKILTIMNVGQEHWQSSIRLFAGIAYSLANFILVYTYRI